MTTELRSSLLQCSESYPALGVAEGKNHNQKWRFFQCEGTNKNNNCYVPNITKEALYSDGARNNNNTPPLPLPPPVAAALETSAEAINTTTVLISFVHSLRVEELCVIINPSCGSHMCHSFLFRPEICFMCSNISRYTLQNPPAGARIADYHPQVAGRSPPRYGRVGVRIDILSRVLEPTTKAQQQRLQYWLYYVRYCLLNTVLVLVFSECMMMLQRYIYI